MGYERAHRGVGHSSPGADSSASAPGKRTLTASLPSTVQRKADGAATGEVHAAAAQGVAGAGSELPHRAAIQASFGPAFDVGGIRAHVGGAAATASQAIGASAYATGNDVAFRGQPDLHTAAHEAAHVVQQARGVNLYGGVGAAGDSYERHADAVADRVVAGQSAAELLASGPSGGGGGAAVQRKEEDEPPDAVLDPLVAGELANLGQGTDLGYSYIFFDARMDHAFKLLCARWGIPLFPPTEGEPGKTGAPADPSTKPKPEAKAAGGDSEGRGVAKLPGWFNAMQNKVIAATTWTRFEKASQAFLESFLRANYPNAPANVQVFFHHVGKSETNKASNEMVPGSTSSGIWCQGASTMPVVKALNDAGYRFTARTAPRAMPWAKVKAGDKISSGQQDMLYSLWLGDNPGKGSPDGAAAPPPRTIGLPASASAPLEPGDVISLVTSATPSSGHVGTIVEFKDPVISMVSGNAGGAAPGQGAIRIEDVPRVPLPEGAYWDTSGKVNTPGKTVPAKPGVCWVVSIQKTSQLDPKRLDPLDDAALAKLGLERKPVSA